MFDLKLGSLGKSEVFKIIPGLPGLNFYSTLTKSVPDRPKVSG